MVLFQLTDVLIAFVLLIGLLSFDKLVELSFLFFKVCIDIPNFLLQIHKFNRQLLCMLIRLS